MDSWAVKQSMLVMHIQSSVEQVIDNASTVGKKDHVGHTIGQTNNVGNTSAVGKTGHVGNSFAAGKTEHVDNASAVGKTDS